MSPKLKVLALSVVAPMVFSAFVTKDAVAETGGHFTSDATTALTIIKGTESGTHTTELALPGLTGSVCGQISYKGTVTGATSGSVSVMPSYSGCRTTGGTAGESNIALNGCNYQFTIGNKSTGDNTVDIVCAGETKYITFTHPSCETGVPAQNGILGIASNTIVENSKHSVTLAVTARGITVHFEAGFCVLLGTRGVAEMTGSATVRGFEDIAGVPGNQVNITATGSEG